MDKKSLMLLISTLVVGMFTGAYFYVTVFAPAYKDKNISSQPTDQNAVIIEGQMLGSCESTNTCASFKLVDDRTYDYLAYPGAKLQHGSVSDTLSREIFSKIGTIAFFDDAKQIAVNACASKSDTLEYSYTVTLSSKAYVLDTCTTAFVSDKALRASFASVWPALENPATAYPPIVQTGILNYFFYLFQHPHTKN